MARRRRPSVEQQTADRKVIQHTSGIVGAIADSTGSAELKMASRLLTEFVATSVVHPKKRASLPKPAARSFDQQAQAIAGEASR